MSGAKIIIERCSNGWIIETSKGKVIHGDAHSAWLHIGNFLMPNTASSAILEEILSKKKDEVNEMLKTVKVIKV